MILAATLNSMAAVHGLGVRRQSAAPTPLWMIRSTGPFTHDGAFCYGGVWTHVDAFTYDDPSFTTMKNPECCGAATSHRSTPKE